MLEIWRKVFLGDVCGDKMLNTMTVEEGIDEGIEVAEQEGMQEEMGKNSRRLQMKKPFA